MGKGKASNARCLSPCDGARKDGAFDSDGVRVVPRGVPLTTKNTREIIGFSSAIEKGHLLPDVPCRVTEGLPPEARNVLKKKTSQWVPERRYLPKQTHNSLSWIPLNITEGHKRRRWHSGFSSTPDMMRL